MPTNGTIVRQRRPWSFEGGIALGGGVYEYTRSLVITAAQMVATTANGFGHANGLELVPAQGAGFFLELISTVVAFTFGVAAYTGGGNVTVNMGGGGAALTGLISAANSFGAAASKYFIFQPLAAAVGTGITVNTGINIVAAAAFTQPGTATGTARVNTTFRVHPIA